MRPISILQGWFNVQKLMTIIHYINRMKNNKKTHDHLSRCRKNI